MLVDLHDRGWDGHSSCGPLNHDTVQQVMAAKWAVDVINNQSLPHELSIGKLAHILHDNDNWREMRRYKL